MAIDGTYGFVYCGAEDIGIGVFTVSGGSVAGRDFAGVATLERPTKIPMGQLI
jgi:hypothetical protein